MRESKLRKISTEFAVQVIRVCAQLREYPSLSGRLERAATNIGVNIYGAIHTSKNSDLTAKLQVALMGCREADYCLELFQRAELLDRETVDKLTQQSHEISRILTRTIKILQEDAS